MKKIVYNKLDFVYFWIIFFISLQSYYFTKINFAPFPPISIILLLFVNNKIKKKNINILFFILLTFLTSAIIGYINNNYYLYIPTLLGALLGPIFLFLFINIDFPSKNELLRNIKNVLIIHLIFFYLQLIIYYSTGFKLDFLFYITGEMSRNDAYGVISDFFRPSGLLNEPATYSLFVFGFSTIYFWGLKKIDFVLILANISLLLSFSASGIILFLLLLVIVFTEYFPYKILIIIVLLITFVLITFNYYFSENIFVVYFQNRFMNGLDSDGSASQRFSSAYQIFLNSNIKNKILGYGIGYTPPGLDTAVGSGLSSHLISFGILFNLIILLIFHSLFKNVQFKFLFFFLIMLTTSMTYNVLHYWLFISLIIIISKYNIRSID
jgi:hypothetical protein